MTTIRATDLALERQSGFRLGPLSLDVASGSKTALIGPSGSGKTTLLRCLAGLERPAQGTIQFGDRLMNSPRAFVQPRERKIGFVFQDGALWPHLTAERQLRFVEPSLTRTSAIDLLERVGLAHLADRRPSQMSGGESQRLALARALAGEPHVLMLDEPLHSVDVHLRDELALLIRRVAEEANLTLLVVTHDREEAFAIADELIVLLDGQVVESGSVTKLLREPCTAFGAKFLCRASSLPASREADGRLRTAFGLHEAPDTLGTGPMSLVLLPGDVVLSEAADSPKGRVLQVIPGFHRGGEAIATVELAGMPVQVACSETVQPGGILALGLRGAARFLPSNPKHGVQ